MNFACELMDLCRGTQEVEAVLSESNDDHGTYNPLERLKMAMEYEEKKVGYHDIIIGAFTSNRQNTHGQYHIFLLLYVFSSDPLDSGPELTIDYPF